MEPPSFNEWLKHEFDNRPRMNQTALAISIGVGHSTVSKWLQALSTPDPEKCHKLASFFGVSSDYVLALAGHRKLPDPTGDLAETRPVYRTGPRADLARLLDRLTDDQVHSLLKFLESLL